MDYVEEILRAIEGNPGAAENNFFKENGILLIDFIESHVLSEKQVLDAAVKRGNREVIQAIIRSKIASPKLFMHALYALPKIGIGVDYDSVMNGEFVLRSSHQSMSARILTRFKTCSAETNNYKFKVSHDEYVKAALHFNQPLWYLALMGRMEDLEHLDILLSKVETSFWKAFLKRKMYLPINKYLQPTSDERIRFAVGGLQKRMEDCIKCREMALAGFNDRKEGLENQLKCLQHIAKKKIKCIDELVQVAINSIREELETPDANSEEFEDPEDMNGEEEGLEELYVDGRFEPCQPSEDAEEEPVEEEHPTSCEDNGESSPEEDPFEVATMNPDEPKDRDADRGQRIISEIKDI